MTDTLRILGFADGRSSKITEPLSGLEHSEVVTAANREGISKYAYLLRVGSNQIVEFQPDVLLSNHPGRLGAVTLSLGRLHGVPVVIRIAGDMWKTNYEELRREIDDRNPLSALARGGQIGLNKLFGANADGYIVVSNELEQLVTARTGCAPERVRRVPVPITAESYCGGDPVNGRECVGRNAEQMLLTVTNLRFRGKIDGVRHLIREVEPVLRENSEITYVIAGGGQYLENLRQYVERAVPGVIRDQIVIAGFVSNVEDLYAAADAFAYCSYVDGYPNVVSEAMAAGLPVVANADHGMVEQIAHGETGLLVDPDERGEFSRAIARLLSDDALAIRLGATARQRVCTRNDPDQIGSQLSAALAEIVAVIR